MAAILRRDWVRIMVFAGLRGVDIMNSYFKLIQKKIYEPLGFELRTLAGVPEEPDRPLSPDELAIAWGLHAELFYPAIRRWAYGMNIPVDPSRHIRSSVARFLRGAPAAMREARVESAA